MAVKTASVIDPAGRDYYQRKRAEGKRHHGARIALARRKVSVLHAMLRTSTEYTVGGPPLLRSPLRQEDPR